MNCLSWTYILKKQTKRYSESHKELATLVTFPAMRESNARQQGGKNKINTYFLDQRDLFFLFAIISKKTILKLMRIGELASIL